jgi:hypothetical protein
MSADDHQNTLSKEEKIRFVNNMMCENDINDLIHRMTLSE